MANKYTSIGGQALIEGIMMKSPEKTAIAVRTPDKSIDISYMNGKSVREKYKILALPIVRGVVGFVESMLQGYKALSISAEKSGFAEEESDTPKTEEQKKKDSQFLNVVMVIGAVLGVVLALGLFMYLPRLCVSGIEWLIKESINSKILRSVIEQALKMTIFVGYVMLVSLMNDIKRVYMYHGAEHKTIFCYEKGLELTVENVRQQKRFHPRCGTSFMILMILISVILSTVLQIIFPNIYAIPWLWTIAKLLMVPLTCGIGFEVLKFCGRFDNIITRIISAPGMWLQRVTTKEPTDDMIEVAIAALKACEPAVPDVDRTGCCNDNI
jgi:uncharacterized protein YqhQ